MTGFGIYMVVFYILSIAANFYYAGEGEVTHTRGVLLFSAVWAMVNLAGILLIGTGAL